MKAYIELFFNHNKERFATYLKDVKSRKEKIAVGAMLPYEIIADLLCYYDGIVAGVQWKINNGSINKVSNCDVEVEDLQRKRMVNDLLQMKNCKIVWLFVMCLEEYRGFQ